MTITYTFTDDDKDSLVLVQKTEQMFLSLLELNRELKGSSLELFNRILKNNDLNIKKLSNSLQ